MFKTGKILITRNIMNGIESNTEFKKEILKSFNCYMIGKWGEISEEDKKANDKAAKSDDRILAVYNTSKGKVYIITEWDRSVTTILFASEY